MRRLRFLILGSLIVLAVSSLGWSQANQKSHQVTMQVPSIAVLALSGGNITLALEAPATGGETPADDTDVTMYLRFTATVPAAQTRTITAAWGTDSAPAGTELNLTAATPGGTNQGTMAGQITVSDTATSILTGIASSATGTGGTDGSNLTYALSVTAVTNLVASDSEVATVTFTLTDAS